MAEFIFDIDNVLIYYRPDIFLRTLWKNDERARRLYELVFLSPEWRMLNEGSINTQDAVEWICHRSPAETDHIRLVFKHWLRCLTPKWETVALLQDLKEQGKKLYFIANMNADAREYILSTYPFFTLFDGGVFSCDEKSSKPDMLIYQKLIHKFHLEPSQCVYSDDIRDNLTPAEHCGMKTVLFTGVERLRDMML